MMSSGEETVTINDMSVSVQMKKFCLDDKIQKPVIDKLLDSGFDSLPAFISENSSWLVQVNSAYNKVTQKQ